jgi:hypothetical protein
VVVEMVWKVWMTVVFVSSSSSGSSLMLGLGLSGSLSGSSAMLWVGLFGASRRDSKDVFVSEIMASDGGSQEGVRA